MTIILCLLVCQPTTAEARSNLYTKPAAAVPAAISKESTSASESRLDRSQKQKTPMKHNTSGVVGNLDAEILVANSKFRAEETSVILPSVRKGIHLKGLRIGDVISAEIPKSLIAFPDAKAPIRSRIGKGDVKGSILLGEASLEKNSKRILIDFKKYRALAGTEGYQLSASALNSMGILGIKGEYINQERRYFAAECFG